MLLFACTAQDGFGRSPLHEAVEFGHKQVVEEILAWEGSRQLVSAPDELGWTALHWAALKGSEDIAQRLLDAKAKVDSKENEFGCEPLQWAARRGHLQLIRLLLNNGAVAAYQDRENRTAAQWAHLTNHLSAFALLEGLELQSEDEEVQQEVYNMSRLHAAVAKNNITEMKNIMKSTEAKEMLLKVDIWGRTPLITAIQASHKATGPGSEKLVLQLIRLIKALPSEGMKGVFLPDRDRRDPVHWAVLAGHRQVALELSQMVPSDTPPSDRWGNRLFHHAAANGHSMMMEWLLDQRAVVDGISDSRQTPLHMAAAGGHLDVTKLLLRRGAPLDAQDSFLSLQSLCMFQRCFVVVVCSKSLLMSNDKHILDGLHIVVCNNLGTVANCRDGQWPISRCTFSSVPSCTMDATGFDDWNFWSFTHKNTQDKNVYIHTVNIRKQAYKCI